MKGNVKIAVAGAFTGGLLLGIVLHALLTSDDWMTVDEGMSHVEEEHSGDHEAQTAEFVSLSEEELEEFSIELETAGPGTLSIHTHLSGEIVIDPDRLAHIVPRFPGVVREVRKRIGDRVKRGEVIAVIESNESLAPYEVKSLIDGTVIDLHMTRGELIEDEDHTIVVADLSQVWADFSVYQKDLPRVRIGQSVTIHTATGAQDTRGEISYVSPVVDEETRTAIARVILPNPDGYWKPGLFVRGVLAVDEVAGGIVVPRSAVETMDGRDIVFVLTEHGFEPRTVVLGRSNETHVEVVGGLEAGERYVAGNGFTLKAEFEKSSFGDGHGH